MTDVGTSELSARWATELHDQINALTGLASTSSSKYDDLKEWMSEQLMVAPAVCYLSDFGKQWTARVGQALMGLPSLLVLLIDGAPAGDVVARLERLHGYAIGLEASLLCFGREGEWTVHGVVGVPGRRAFDLLRGTLNQGAASAETNLRVRVARPSGSFFDLDPDQQAARVWQHLVGLGSMPVSDAIARAARALRDEGVLDYTRLRSDGLVYTEIENALRYATRRSLYFDRPRTGEIRAVKPDADDFTVGDWRRCVLSALGQTATQLETVLRSAAAFAVDTYGLNLVRLRSGGRVDKLLRAASSELVRSGLVLEENGRLVRASDVESLAEDEADRPAAHRYGSTPPPSERGTLQAVDVAVATKRATPPEQLRKLVGHIPADAESVFERLLGEPEMHKDELLAAVEAHITEFRRQFEYQMFLDMRGAAMLQEQCHKLLDAWERLSVDHRRIAQAGIRYFVASDEGDDDFVLDGLRTDKAVMTAVLEAVL